MKQIHSETRINLWLYGSILIVTVIIIICYTVNFWNYNILKDNDAWGTFGDYFGGILNPIIGIANIIVFVHLTRTISELDKNNNQRAIDANDNNNKLALEANEKNNERAIEVQKLLFKLQLKHSIYNEIANLLTKFPELLAVDKPYPAMENLTLYMNNLFNLIDNNKYLFKSLDGEEIKKIRKTILGLVLELRECVTADEKSQTYLYNVITKKFDYHPFLLEKAKFLKCMQSELI